MDATSAAAAPAHSVVVDVPAAASPAHASDAKDAPAASEQQHIYPSADNAADAAAGNENDNDNDNADETAALLPSSPTKKKYTTSGSLVYSCVIATLALFVVAVILLSVIYAIILPKRLQEDYTDSAEPRFFYFDIQNLTDTGAVVSFNGSIDTYGDLRVRFFKNVHNLETMGPLAGFDDHAGSPGVYLDNWRPRRLLTVMMPDIVTSPVEFIPLNISNSIVHMGPGEDRQWFVKFIQEGVLGNQLKSKDLHFRLWSNVETIIEEPWYRFGGFHWRDLEVEDFLDFSIPDLGSVLGGGKSLANAAGGLNLAAFNISLDFSNSRFSLLPFTGGDIRFGLTNPYNFGLHAGAISLNVSTGSQQVLSVALPNLDLNARNLQRDSKFQVLLNPTAGTTLPSLLPLLSSPVNISGIRVDYPGRKVSGVGSWVDEVLNGVSLNVNLPLPLPSGGDIDLCALLDTAKALFNIANVIGLQISHNGTTDAKLALLPAVDVSVPVAVYNPTLLGFALQNVSAVLGVNGKDLVQIIIDPLDLLPMQELQTTPRIKTLPNVNPLSLLDLLNVLNGGSPGEDLLISQHNLTLGSSALVNKLLSGIALNVSLGDSGLNLDYALDVAFDEIASIVTPLVQLTDLAVDLADSAIYASLSLTNPSDYGLYIGNVSLTVVVGNDVELNLEISNLNIAPQATNVAQIVIPGFSLAQVLGLLTSIGSGPEIPLTLKNIRITNEAADPATYERVNGLLSLLNLNVAIPSVSTGNLDIFGLLGKLFELLDSVNLLELSLDIDITSVKRITILPVVDLSLAVSFVNPTDIGFALQNSSVTIGVNSTDILTVSLLPLNLMPTAESSTVLNLRSVPGTPLSALLGLLNREGADDDLVVTVHNIVLGNSDKLNSLLSNVSVNVVVPKNGGIQLNYTLGIVFDDIADILIPLVKFENIELLLAQEPIAAGADIIYTSTTDYAIFVGNVTFKLAFQGNNLFNVFVSNFDLLPMAVSTVRIDAIGDDGVTLDDFLPLLDLVTAGEPIPLTISDVAVVNSDHPNNRLNGFLSTLDLNVVIPPIQLGLQAAAASAAFAVQPAAPQLPIQIEPFGSLLRVGLVGFLQNIFADMAKAKSKTI